MVGRSAMNLDANFPIKTAILYRAVGKKSAIASAPGGPELLAAIRACKITKASIDAIVREHLEFLLSVALECARGHGVKVTTIGLSYACYLCPKEKVNYFDLFMDYYLDMARSVCGQDMRYETCSEGQGTASYICLPYRDPLRGPRRTLIRDLFPDVVWGESVVLVIVDSGSSSVV